MQHAKRMLVGKMIRRQSPEYDELTEEEAMEKESEQILGLFID